MRAGLAGMGLPEDLVQLVPQPVDRPRTQALMQAVDLVVCTGSQTNVREAYRSGTPAIGVGAGNVPVIVDESADLPDAADKVARSKCFDNATSCSSENALVVLDAVYPDVIATLAAQGGHLCSAAERAAAAGALFRGGRLSRALIAKDAAMIARRSASAPRRRARASSWSRRPASDAAHPFSGEKLSLVLALYRARDFANAKALCRALLEHAGRGRRSASTPAGRSAPARSPRSSTWSACWSTRRTPSATAAASTTACRSRCRWAAAPGPATRSPRTSAGATSSTSPTW